MTTAELYALKIPPDLADDYAKIRDLPEWSVMPNHLRAVYIVAAAGRTPERKREIRRALVGEFVDLNIGDLDL